MAAYQRAYTDNQIVNKMLCSSPIGAPEHNLPPHGRKDDGK